jgi:hypothetical protein
MIWVFFGIFVLYKKLPLRHPFALLLEDYKTSSDEKRQYDGRMRFGAPPFVYSRESLKGTIA